MTSCSFFCTLQFAKKAVVCFFQSLPCSLPSYSVFNVLAAPFRDSFSIISQAFSVVNKFFQVFRNFFPICPQAAFLPVPLRRWTLNITYSDNNFKGFAKNFTLSRSSQSVTARQALNERVGPVRSARVGVRPGVFSPTQTDASLSAKRIRRLRRKTSPRRNRDSPRLRPAP